MKYLVNKRPEDTQSPPVSAVEVLYFDLPIPPSANNLYQMRRGGKGLTLTKEATTYQNQVKEVISRQIVNLSKFPRSLVFAYRMDVVLALDSVTNAGWFRVKNGQRDAKTLFKTIDTDNRIKFLQDCIVRSVGIPNDSQVFDGDRKKREDPGNPRAYVRLSVLELEDFTLKKEELWDD